MHNFTWDGKSSADFGIMIEKDPDKNRPARKYFVSNVMGRNGNLYSLQNAYEEVERKYNLFSSVGRDAIDADGNTVEVNRSYVSLANLQIDFSLIQEGTGNPTPDNVRNINVVNSLTLTVSNGANSKDYTIALGRYIGIGSLNVITGNLTITHMYDSNMALKTWDKVVLADEDNAYYFKTALSFNTPQHAELYCNCFTPVSEAVGMASWRCTIYNNEFRIRPDNTVTTVADLRRWLFNHAVEIVYKLETPVEYQLTPVAVSLRYGENVCTTDFSGAEVTHIGATGLKPQNELLTDIVEWLYEPNDYTRLSDTYDPDHYRDAVLVNAVSVRDLWQTYGRAEVTFRCRPERFLTNAYYTYTSEQGSVTAVQATRTAGVYEHLSFIMPQASMAQGEFAKWLEDVTVPTRIKTVAEVTAYRDVELTDVAETLPANNYYRVIETMYEGTYTIEVGDVYRHIQIDNKTEVYTSELYYKVQTYDTEIVGYVDSYYCNGKVGVHELNNPTKHTAKPIIILNRNSAYHEITVNDIIMHINYQNSDDSIIVNCENENVTSGDSAINTNVSITTADGNPTARFLSLKKGINIIQYDGDFELDTRFWEL